MTEFNLVQRFARGKEVLCYVIRWGKVARDPKWRFPTRSAEFVMATVEFSLRERLPIRRVKFHVIDGFFSLMTFDRSPTDIRSNEVLIHDVAIHPEPLERPAPEARPFLPIGWLREWKERYGISRVSPPVSAAVRAEMLSAIDSSLPDDYAELLEQADGLVVDRCAILGLAEVHDVTLDTGRFYVIAEVPDVGMLGVAAGARDKMIYLLTYEADPPSMLGSSLRRAIESSIDGVADA